MSEKDWLPEKLRFQCQGSGNCCVSRGQYGYVYMTQSDRKRMAKELNLKTSEFTKKYCKRDGDGFFFLVTGPESHECIFLENGNRCRVYKGRPSQCRTWPFWPEVMNAKIWKKEVASYCPGVGKGKLWSKKQMQKILDEQKASEEELQNDTQ